MLEQRFGRVGYYMSNSLLVFIWLLILFLALIAGFNVFSAVFASVTGPVEFRVVSFWAIILIVLPVLAYLAHFIATRCLMVLRRTEAVRDEAKRILNETKGHQDKTNSLAKEVEEEMNELGKLLNEVQNATRDQGGSTPAS